MYDWIISDTHFNHQNIVAYAGRPKNHNELMQENWRKTVMPDDSVLCLGDVLMGRQELWESMPGWLPGHITCLDSGNHDEPHKRRFLESKGWKFIPEFQIFYRGWIVFFTHYPKGTILSPGAKRNTDLEIKDMLLPRMLNCHGHIHEKALNSPQFINVCVEQLGYTPVRLEELLDSRIEMLEDRNAS